MCGDAAASSRTQEGRTDVIFEHHTLARRLEIGDTSAIGSEKGWQMRVMLVWQRLVRAGKVQHQRRKSDIWREAERRWCAQRAAGYATLLQRREDWAVSGARTRGHVYDWHKQQRVMDLCDGTTSGAAAVIARRAAADVGGTVGHLKRPRSSPAPAAARRHSG